MNRWPTISYYTFLSVTGCLAVIALFGCSDRVVEPDAPPPTSEQAVTNMETDMVRQAEERISALPPFEADAAEQAVTQSRTRSRFHAVRPGGSIQHAVDQAQPGGVVLIWPGTYRQTVLVDKPNLRIVGLNLGPQGVIIENPSDKRNGIRVTEQGDGFALANLSVRGFGSNGVLLVGVDQFLLYRVDTQDNGAYGLFPVLSSRGFITQCSASGHADAGIYIGQSESVLIFDNEAQGNVLGFEVENSSNVLVSRNRSFGNTVGLLNVLLPDLQVKTSAGVFVAHNRFENNNLENFADPDDIAASVPSGSGLLNVGVDEVILLRNRVTGNDFVGVGVASLCALAALMGESCEAFAPDIELNSDGVQVRRNHVTGNGQGDPSVPLPPADLFWDGTGTDNCWEANTFDTSFPETLPSCDAPA